MPLSTLQSRLSRLVFFTAACVACSSTEADPVASRSPVRTADSQALQAQEPEPEFSLQLVDNGNGFVGEQAAPPERGFIPSTAQRPRAPSPLDDATDTGVYDGKRAVEQKIAAADSSQLVDLIFVLNAPQFPWRELRNPAATVESREWFFSLRAQQTESITAEFGKALMRIGVHEFGVDPFTPTVQAMMTKEQALKAIAELQFASVDLNSREGSHSGYDVVSWLRKRRRWRAGGLVTAWTTAKG